MFGSDHFYGSPECKELYGCISYDPEGILGSLSACTLTYLGLITGRILLHLKEHKDRLITFFISSMILFLVSGSLCDFTQNGGLIPINKNLWSTSYVLLMAGSGFIGLGICYIFVDVWGIWSGAPFKYLGVDPPLGFTIGSTCGPLEHSVLGPTLHHDLNEAYNTKYSTGGPHLKYLALAPPQQNIEY